jgi:adenylate kinase family enzyme
MKRKILIMGLPGAGKTTLANTLAPLLNAVVFNADTPTFRATSVLATKTASSTHGAWAGCAIEWWKRAGR